MKSKATRTLVDKELLARLEDEAWLQSHPGRTAEDIMRAAEGRGPAVSGGQSPYQRMRRQVEARLNRLTPDDWDRLRSILKGRFKVQQQRQQSDGSDVPDGTKGER